MPGTALRAGPGPLGSPQRRGLKRVPWLLPLPPPVLAELSPGTSRAAEGGGTLPPRPLRAGPCARAAPGCSRPGATSCRTPSRDHLGPLGWWVLKLEEAKGSDRVEMREQRFAKAEKGPVPHPVAWVTRIKELGRGGGGAPLTRTQRHPTVSWDAATRHSFPPITKPPQPPHTPMGTPHGHPDI
jgi:hypothetical protein